MAEAWLQQLSSERHRRKKQRGTLMPHQEEKEIQGSSALGWCRLTGWCCTVWFIFRVEELELMYRLLGSRGEAVGLNCGENRVRAEKLGPQEAAAKGEANKWATQT